MASMRISGMKLFRFSVKSSARFDVRPPITFARLSSNVPIFNQNGFGMIRFSSANFCQGMGMVRFNCSNFSQYSRGCNCVLGFSNRILGNSGYGRSSPLINFRVFSSATDGKGTPGDVTELGAHGASMSDNSVSTDDWILQSAVEKANKTFSGAALWLDANPYLRDLIVPVGGTLAGTLLVWSLLLFHKNSVERQAWKGASKDILVKDPSVQTSHPFSIGDTIKVGSVEGQVVEMGPTTTTLRTVENIPVVVPNSLFASQVIVNKSRARFRSMVKKVYIQNDAIDKVPIISEDIKSMLRSNSNVFLGLAPPYCFFTEFKRYSLELTFGCILNQVDEEAENDILLKALEIIKEHGANLN